MKFRSTLFAELRGSMAGMTAARNKGGNYLRARATPTNPDSTAQQRARQAFAEAVQAWDALTGAQRTSWAGYAVETPVMDKLGQEIRHAGRSWYIAQHAFLTNAGATPATNAPATPGLLAIGEPSVALELDDANGLTVAFGNGTVPSSAVSLIAQIGPPLSPGVTYFKGPYTQVGAVTTNEFSAEAIPANRYGLPTLAQIRPMRFRACNNEGKLSNVYEQLITVTEE